VFRTTLLTLRGIKVQSVEASDLYHVLFSLIEWLEDEDARYDDIGDHATCELIYRIIAKVQFEIMLLNRD
jgi:hypothetical protein